MFTAASKSSSSAAFSRNRQATRMSKRHHSLDLHSQFPRANLWPILKDGTDGTVPPEAYTLPASDYVDSAAFTKERQGIFAREWLYVCRENELTGPGSFSQLEVADFSIFVIRGRDLQLNGFHNVCSHRAGPIITEKKGRCDILRCKYHGWLYDTEGNLKRAPDFGANLNKAALSLRKVLVQTWRGLVFANMDLGAAPLQKEYEHLEPLLRPWDFENMLTAEEKTYDVGCNWKTYVDNYMEGYHIPDVHPVLQREIRMPEYRVHVAREGRFACHEVPMRATDTLSNTGQWVWKFPALAFNCYGYGASIERMIPTSPTKMQIRYTYLFAKDAPAAAVQASMASSGQLTEEDIRICEQVQANLQRGIYRAGPLSPRHENGIWAFHSWVRGALNAVTGAKPTADIGLPPEYHANVNKPERITKREAC